MEKVWLKSYPKGVPSEINLDEFQSLVDLFNQTCDRFNDQPAFTNFGVEVSFRELKSHSENLSSYLLNEFNIKKGDRVLEVGTGSGYQTAILLALDGIEVYTIERQHELFKKTVLFISYIFFIV